MPVDRIPLFVKKGSILPVIDQVMYADAAEEMELKLNVYTGMKPLHYDVKLIKK